MAKKIYNYKDKKVIISLFNESQSHYKRYEELVEGNATEAQKELNTAGNKLQQSYELGLKCYLNKRYRELYDNKVLTWKEHLKLVKVIEKGKQDNHTMVDVRYLSVQMDLYANPERKKTDIDFELIKKNTKPVYNDNKHIGNDVDVNMFKESYAEIRKFLLTYIDPNPPIQIIQSPEYMNLQEACDFWETTKYNYCLICDKLNLNDMERRRLLYINWSLIIDFDTGTGENGLLKSYINEYNVQPNSFNILNPKKTLFNPASKLPYWFHINGLNDTPESLVESDRKWNQKYGAQLSDCLCKYREVFSKPLKVIILGGYAKRIDKILTELDAIYEDSLKVYLLSQEVQYESITEEYDEILSKFPMSENDFSQGINNFASLFREKSSKDGYYVCGREGKVEIKLEEYSSFEIPYLGIENVEISDSDKNCELFYQGGNALSWYGVQNGFAISRILHYRRIKNSIINASKETTSRIVRLNHDPGAGGTTLSRMIAYHLSKEMPVLLLKSYNERITPVQVSNFYRLVDMSILIVVENAVISDDDLKKFNGELMSKAVPHVFLYVSRLKKRLDSSDDDLRYLIDDEFNEMLDKLNPYLITERKNEVMNLSKNLKDRYPFFMSMYAFEDKFQGVKDYISHYLVDISKNDKKILEYISLVDWFANKTLDVSFLNSYDDGEGLFENSVNENLVNIDSVGHNTFVKMRHPKFAEEIIMQRIGNGVNDKPLEMAEKLSQFLREFIRYSKQNIMFDFDSTIDVLRSLLILRDTESMIYSKFAPVIEYLENLIPADVDEHEKYNCIGLVFKELVNTYTEEPHFKAHLSRYYTHIEKSYGKGINEAKEAVILAEQMGEYDSLLYHIYGMSIKKYVEQKLYNDAIDCRDFNEQKLLSEKLQEIQHCLEVASEQFKKVRETNNKVAGYISDIEMCIDVVDFGKELYNCSTEQFIIQYKDSWLMEYYDRALTLLEGFRTMQVEEDTEFYKVRLTTKCAESLQDMIGNIESTVEMWQEYLSRAEEAQKPVVRRFIARAKEKDYLSNTSEQNENVELVMQLMEDNIKEEPENGANIRIWFNALRYIEEKNDDILLDDALQKLAKWKKIGDNLEAYYYYFVLVCIKAIEGSSRAEAIIPELQEELKAKTSHMPNNRVIYEWLGEGRGVHRLINTYEQRNGKYHKKSIDAIEKEAYYLEGRISKYKSDRSAQIKAYNMEVFFTPSGQINQATLEDVNKKVQFILGFSYDGLRALNKSVQLIDFSQEDSSDEIIGKTVRCIVMGPDNTGNYLKVKLCDYRNAIGSIHSSELPKDKTVYDYEYQETIYGKVIGERYIEKEGRSYYQLRLKEDEMTDWQRQLSKFGKKIM